MLPYLALMLAISAGLTVYIGAPVTIILPPIPVILFFLANAPITGRISLADPAMEVRTLPGGTFLTLLSRGPHSDLHGAWTRIGAYAEEHGYIPAGPHREVYLSDPNVVAEEELLTELQIPIAPQSS